MINALEHYRSLSQELERVREKHQGQDSEEEDAILDVMDDAWYALTPEERATLDKPPA